MGSLKSLPEFHTTKFCVDKVAKSVQCFQCCVSLSIYGNYKVAIKWNDVPVVDTPFH